MIKALVKKDWRWLLLMSVAGVVTLLIAYDQTRFEQVWVLPTSRGEMIYITWWICGGSLGLIAATIEEVGKTREYLTHRPVSQAQVLTGKLVGCGLVLALWLVATSILSIALEAIWGRNVQLTELSNLGDHMLLATPAVSLCAVGIFAGTLPLHCLMRALVAGCTGLTVLLAGQLLTTHADSQLNDTVLWLVFHGVVTSGLVLVSYANVREVYDPDINAKSPRRLLILAVALAGTTLAGTWGIATVQHELRGQVRQAMPRIIEDTNGAYRLARRLRDDDNKYTWQEVDADHKRIGRMDKVKSQVLWRSNWPDSRADFGVSEPRFNQSSSYWGYRERPLLIQPSGLVYQFYGRDTWRDSEKLKVIGMGPEHLPFPPSAQLVGVIRTENPEANQRGSIVFDHSDGSLWKHSWKPGAPDYYVPIHLPGNEQVQSTFRVRPPSGASNPDSGILSFMRDGQVISSVTETYYYDGESFQVAPAWAKAEVERQRTRVNQLAVSTSVHDILAPSVQIVSPEDSKTILFRHDMAAHTPYEVFTVGAAILPSVLRPPILQVASYLQPAPTRAPGFGEAPYLDPILAGGRRTWLLALTIVVTLAVAFRFRSRLRILGAPAATQRFWLVAIVLLGPIAAMLALLIETRRAYHRPSTSTEASGIEATDSQLLIHSS